MVPVKRKRGRPSNAELAERRKAEAEKAAKLNRPDAVILKELKERFTLLELLSEAAALGQIRALVVSGGPGIGKTFRIQQVLERVSRQEMYEVNSGGVSPVNVYKLGYRTRMPRQVAVLDDADEIFRDEDSLNLVKAMCDSSLTRKVSWLKESAALREEDIPQVYEYEGAMIFVTNLDMQGAIDEGRSANIPHYEALISRAMYLDLRIYTRREKAIWVSHVATEGKIFAREGIDTKTGAKILKYISDKREELRTLDVRTVLKMCQLVNSPKVVKEFGGKWETAADHLMCRQ
jgi:hypothetical protein